MFQLVINGPSLVSKLRIVASTLLDASSAESHSEAGNLSPMVYLLGKFSLSPVGPISYI